MIHIGRVGRAHNSYLKEIPKAKEERREEMEIDDQGVERSGALHKG